MAKHCKIIFVIQLSRTKEIALAMFDKHHCLRTFHVTFAILQSRIVCIRTNNAKTHSVNLRNPKHNSQSGLDISASKFECSEFRALHYLKQTTNVDFRKVTLINVRIRKNKTFGLAKPCESCRSLIKYHGIKTVIYTNDVGEFVISQY